MSVVVIVEAHEAAATFLLRLIASNRAMHVFEG